MKKMLKVLLCNTTYHMVMSTEDTRWEFGKVQILWFQREKSKNFNYPQI